MRSVLEPCVTCCNGHKVCEKHYLQRAKAIYEEGRRAFHDDDVHRCFLCRTSMCNDLFSDRYHTVIKCVLLFMEGVQWSGDFLGSKGTTLQKNLLQTRFKSV